MKRAWTIEEIATLRATYPQGCMVAADALPHRSLGVICAKAHALGIKVEKKGSAPYRRREGGEPIARTEAPVPEEPPKRMMRGPHGEMIEWGRTAGTKEGLEPVPEQAQALPWVSFPRDPAACRAIADQLMRWAENSSLARHGEEAAKFFRSHATYLRTLAANMERVAA